MTARIAAALLAALALAGCGGGAELRGGHLPTERLAERLRDYVYASYDLRDPPAPVEIEKLRRARAALVDELARAGIGAPDPDEGIAPLVKRLAARFEARGLHFLPLPDEAAGVALVRAAETRGRVVVFDEYVIRPRAAAGPVAYVGGATIFLDRGRARAHARDLLSAGARWRGDPRTRDELRVRLRNAGLEADAARGEEALAAAILREEEVRMRALVARPMREAVLHAIATGEPRYQAAAALGIALAAPGTENAKGAEAALAALAKDPFELATLDPEEVRRRARAALAGAGGAR